MRQKYNYCEQSNTIRYNYRKIFNTAISIAKEYSSLSNLYEQDFYKEVEQITHLSILEAKKNFNPSKNTHFESWVFFYIRKNLSIAYTSNTSKLFEITLRKDDLKIIFQILGLSYTDEIEILFDDQDTKKEDINSFLRDHYNIIIISRKITILNCCIRGIFRKYIRFISLEKLIEDGIDIKYDKDTSIDDQDNSYLRKYIQELPPHYRKVIEGLYGLSGITKTSYEIGREMGLTPQRVRQIEKEALKYLQKRFLSILPTK